MEKPRINDIVIDINNTNLDRRGIWGDLMILTE